MNRNGEVTGDVWLYVVSRSHEDAIDDADAWDEFTAIIYQVSGSPEVLMYEADCCGVVDALFADQDSMLRRIDGEGIEVGQLFLMEWKYSWWLDYWGECDDEFESEIIAVDFSGHIYSACEV